MACSRKSIPSCSRARCFSNDMRFRFHKRCNSEKALRGGQIIAKVICDLAKSSHASLRASGRQKSQPVTISKLNVAMRWRALSKGAVLERSRALRSVPCSQLSLGLRGGVALQPLPCAPLKSSCFQPTQVACLALPLPSLAGSSSMRFGGASASLSLPISGGKSMTMSSVQETSFMNSLIVPAGDPSSLPRTLGSNVSTLGGRDTASIAPDLDLCKVDMARYATDVEDM